MNVATTTKRVTKRGKARKAVPKSGPGRGKSFGVRPADVHTGTVNQALALMPTFVDYTISHGIALDLNAPTTSPEVVVTPTRPMSQFTDAHVEWAIGFIASSDIHRYLAQEINSVKIKSGRPTRVPTHALLVGMWLSTEEGKGLLLTNIRDILFHRISPTMQDRLGLLGTSTSARRVHDKQWNNAAEASVRRALHRALNRMDPSRTHKNRTQTWFQVKAEAKPLTDDEVLAAQARLDWVCNQLLEAAFQTLPRRIRRQYRGSACIDATPMPSYARGTSTADDSGPASRDPDAGWYRRGGNHADPNLAGRDAKYRTRKEKLMWAYDISLLIAVDDRPGERQHLPALPLAMTVDRPGLHPYDGARRLFASTHQRLYTPGYLAGDNLYTDSKSENFQIPAREYGWDLVLPYKRDQLGAQETHTSGMVMVEGQYHCPAIPENLINATTAYLNEEIDGEARDELMRDRAKHRMRTHSLPTNGTGERLACPASGPSPTAKCPFKPASQIPRNTLQPDGRIRDDRLTITPLPHMSLDEPLDVCKKSSVAVKSTDGAKFRQQLQYGTKEHSAIYNLLRQSQEGFHGFVKDDAYESLASAGKRRVLGKAAQTFFAAFLLTAASIRKIRHFLTEMKEDPETGEIYVQRKKRIGVHATTDNPAGLPLTKEPEQPRDDPNDIDPNGIE